MSGTSPEILCQPNPGIAGTGVVISYILAAVAAVIVPPLASIFKNSEILKKTAASLGITQIITSWAITICGLITYPHSMLDPHATMCLALALLGSASHAIPFWLGEFRTRKASSRLRLGLCAVQSLILFIAFLARKKSLDERSDDESDNHVYRYEAALLVFMTLTLIWDIVLFGSSFVKGGERPGSGLRITNAIIALVFTIYYIATVIHLKFKLRDCDLNTGADNQWTYGQYLALFVLAGPIYSTLEAFLDGREKARREKRSSDEEQVASNDIEMPVIEDRDGSKRGLGSTPQGNGQPAAINDASHSESSE